MAKKVINWKTRGMNRDLSVSAFNPEFAFENMNLRLSTNESNTMLSWVTEKGTQLMTLRIGDDEIEATSLLGHPIGTAVIDDTLVLFTTACIDTESHGTDHIYLIKNGDDQSYLKVTEYYCGDLNLDSTHPLETLTSYESDEIKKVYWVDGKNPFRMLNIEDLDVLNTEPDRFNVLPTLKLNETVTVNKVIAGSGKFPSGVIQYAFTYYNKYGCESNIFYVSSQRYISPIDRGARPDEMVDNVFEITVANVDLNFDYLRIYSIQRTSLNTTPICKRVVDIEIPPLGPNEESKTITYTDTGTTGEVIDPTELLFKNREAIIPTTLEQKDNTLFLGNITRTAKGVPSYISQNTHKLDPTGYTLSAEFRSLTLPQNNSSSSYNYNNQLTVVDSSGEIGVPCSGFKIGNTYRLGVQFQDKTGRWSDPVWVNDYPVPDISDDISDDYHAKIVEGQLKMPRIKCSLNVPCTQSIIAADYVRVRPLIVYPEPQDRLHVCQGVVCPTLYTTEQRSNKTSYGQSSWFLRPLLNSVADNVKSAYSNVKDIPEGGDRDSIQAHTETGSPKSADADAIPYTSTSMSYNPTNSEDIKTVEIEGDYLLKNKFKVDWRLLTFHSPDIEFKDESVYLSFNDTKYAWIGEAKFVKTMSDISIQTETPNIAGSASGFTHKQYIEDGSYGIISGLFYDDAAVDDSLSGNDIKVESFLQNDSTKEHSPYKWLVYPWSKEGSINNDVQRPSGAGVQSALLKKKVISNLRIADTIYTETSNTTVKAFDRGSPVVFNSNNESLIKLNLKNDIEPYPYIEDVFYQGNIDTLLSPDGYSSLFFAFDDDDYNTKAITTTLGSRSYWRVWRYDSDQQGQNIPGALYKYVPGSSPNPWVRKTPNDIIFGDQLPEIAKTKASVRMRYKTSPHLVMYRRDSSIHSRRDYFYLPIYEITKTEVNNPYGGNTADALKSNNWIVAGDTVRLGNTPESINPNTWRTEFYFDYGDMYFQRYDCLKTYAYSSDDTNQVVEIGSFMLEGYSNIDGRYDRNRGQINNLNISPQNFNLINPVYSQPNNFFSYKIVDDDNSKSYVNYITWSKTKTSGQDIDQWTYLTLASTLELEGNKGQLNYIKKFNNQLLAFQDKAVAQILYNENVQISSTAGVPIEIANSGKVEGFRYLTNTIGCSNKFSAVETPAGIYFMDNINKAIYLFNGQFNNLSSSGGFNSWCKQNIPDVKSKWTARFDEYQQMSSKSLSGFVAHYDKLNQDVLFINKDTALAWNERVQSFTSFYSYKDTPYLASLGDLELWFRYRNPSNPDDYSANITTIWQHQGGECCTFFGEPRGYWTTLIGNPEPQMDKTFTNLEFRACVEGDGEYDDSTGKFTPALPFDNLEVWNEYQRGIANLENSQGLDLYTHNSTADGQPASLVRKYRIWRCDIPRDNAIVDIRKEAPLGISRTKAHPLSRMRNPWLYLTIKKQPLVTYRYKRLGSIRGFIIPISEFQAYLDETGNVSCRIADINGASGIASVVYHLIDTRDNYAQRLYLDGSFWNKIPLPNVPITDIEGVQGLINLADTYNADALLIDCSNWGFDPATLELTIYRTEYLKRVELHDLQMSYFD